MTELATTRKEPSQPKELAISKDKITETTIAVSWKEPNPSDVPIVGYEVEYRKSGEDFKKMEKSLTHEDLTCEVTGLAAHTEYEFRVAAINAAGCGPFTDVVTQFTMEEKASENIEDKIMSQMPENIKQLRKLVKDKITDKWEEIAIQLGFTPAQIQAIKNDHQARSVKTCCTDMLFDWIDSTQSKNPDKDLVEAIREVGYGYQADQFEEEMKIVDDILEQRYLQTKIIPEIAVRWFEIGLELDIPNGTLEIIKTESDYSGACCLDMLRLWFNRGKNVEKESERPIWKNMYNAMCAIDINFRAEKLRDLLLKDIN